MKKTGSSRFVCLIVAMFVMSMAMETSIVAQARFRSQASAAWSSAATWLLVAGTDADGIPDANDTVDVATGNDVAVGGTTVDCATLQVNAGGRLLIDGAGNVGVNANPGSATILGTLVMSSSGTLLEQGAGTRSFVMGSGSTMTISGSAATPAFDTYAFDPASTVEYTALAAQDVKSGLVFGRLTLGGSGVKTVAPWPPDTAFTCTGKLTVGAGVTFDASTSILHLHFQGDVENAGTIDASVGIVVVRMSGAHWVNNGTLLVSTTPGFGYTPSITFSNTEISGTPVAEPFYSLVIEGTTTALRGLTVDSSLTIAPGATFGAGTGLNHQVKGRWTNGGTFNAGTSTVTFNGSTNQNIGASTFYNMVVNNPSGVTLAGNVTIAAGGTLTVTNGAINTGPYTLAVNATDPAALSLGTNSITGSLSRAIAPGSSATYVFLSANTFVVMGGTGNPSSLTLTSHPNANPPNLAAGADTNMMAKRYYTMAGTGAGPAFTYNLRLPYVQSEVRGNEANYVLWQYVAGGWNNRISSGPANTVDNHVEQNALTGFGEWAIAENLAALPIQLASFGASVLENSTDVRLTWTTVSEVNNYGFSVQRSPSGTPAFIDLPNSFVPGAGTSLTPRHYDWTDLRVAPGNYAYRLKQMDLDGSVWFTEAVQVTVESATGVDDERVPELFSLQQNYPNPFNPSTRIQFSVEKTGYALLTVYDLLGKEIETLFAGTAQAGTRYSLAFDGSALTNGVYFYRLTSGEKTALKKMVMIK